LGRLSQDEVRVAINEIPNDKAPGLDGFTGVFFKRCWETIKLDVMNVLKLFRSLHSKNFNVIYSSNIAFLPKKNGSRDISNYRPFSLIHGTAKMISKMLSLRLGPLMDDLVSNGQSAFIKKTSIHDNSLYVKNRATRLRKNKTSSLSSILTSERNLNPSNRNTLPTFFNAGDFLVVSAIGSWPSSPPPPLELSSMG
jgi:hypothetical protein